MDLSRMYKIPSAWDIRFSRSNFKNLKIAFCASEKIFNSPPLSFVGPFTSCNNCFLLFREGFYNHCHWPRWVCNASDENDQGVQSIQMNHCESFTFESSSFHTPHHLGHLLYRLSLKKIETFFQNQILSSIYLIDLTSFDRNNQALNLTLFKL